VLSAEARNAGYKANAVAMVMKGPTPVIQACGALFEVADKAKTVDGWVCENERLNLSFPRQS
jgi:hypothetical protein